MDESFGIEVGTTVSFSKTVGESDVYLFAGITGDLSPNHVNEEFMRSTSYGRRIAHGVLALGYASTASSLLVAKHDAKAVSYGYDRVRFVAPIFLGDTLTVSYLVTELDSTQAKSYADVIIKNQEGTLCMVARHIMKFLV